MAASSKTDQIAGIFFTAILCRIWHRAKLKTGWVAHCPAHSDSNASLSVSEGNDGRILVHCHAGCSVESIVGALGLKLGDLFPSRQADSGGRKPRIVASYDYMDETGKLLFQCVRYDPKNFK